MHTKLPSSTRLNWSLPFQQEEQSTDGDLPLAPMGLNFQLALFQNQMAQIQMMQAANASAMLNMGNNVGLNTLNTGNLGALYFSRIFGTI